MVMFILGGTNGNGQLGLGDREYKLVPTIIQNLPSSIDIAAAGFFQVMRLI